MGWLPQQAELGAQDPFQSRSTRFKRTTALPGQQKPSHPTFGFCWPFLFLLSEAYFIVSSSSLFAPPIPCRPSRPCAITLTTPFPAPSFRRDKAMTRLDTSSRPDERHQAPALAPSPATQKSRPSWLWLSLCLLLAAGSWLWLVTSKPIYSHDEAISMLAANGSLGEWAEIADNQEALAGTWVSPDRWKRLFIPTPPHKQILQKNG